MVTITRHFRLRYYLCREKENREFFGGLDVKRNTVHPEIQTKSQFHGVTGTQKSREKSYGYRTKLATMTRSFGLRYDLCSEKENREISGGGVLPHPSPPAQPRPEHATSSPRTRSIHPSAQRLRLSPPSRARQAASEPGRLQSRRRRRLPASSQEKVWRL